MIQNAKILCVDDDQAALECYKQLLQHTDYKILTAHTPEKGFESATKNTPDLIISDVFMPDEKGLDFCKKIKQEPHLQNTIILLASASKIQPSHAEKGIEIGADDYLNKPVKKDELRAKIKSFLRIKSLQDNLIGSNKKLNKAMRHLKEYKAELERKNRILIKEKQMIQNSLNQISMMAEERERTNIELKELTRIQKEDFYGLINLLSEVIESKRQYHRGHSKKVAEISGMIAKALGLSNKLIREIRVAALLHELGKLSIPDELAMKNPDKYTEAEKNFLSRHPVKGAEMLVNFSGFRPSSKILRHFHENVDGSGVPDSLRGEDIPLGSRIIAAANVFDNLVYRKKDGSVDKAFEVLDEMTGARLDQKIVFHLHKYATKYPVRDSEKIISVKLFELKPGMKLAAGIYALSGAKLLPINTVLTEESINQLAQYNKKDPIGETVFLK